MSYNGWLLSEQSRTALLERFNPRFPDVIAHHVTLTMGAETIPNEVVAEVVGYAIDDKGLETLVVALDDSTVRPDGDTYHITWSLDRSAGFKPVSSKKVIAQNGFIEINPIPITVIPFFCDNDRVEYTMKSIAQ